jgi:hypothetical protein
MVCSPAEETDGDGRILKRGDQRWSSGRPNRRRPGHQGARVSSAWGRGEVGDHGDVLTEVGMQGGGRIPATTEDRRSGSGFTGGGACGGEDRDVGARESAKGQLQGLRVGFIG